ncbi:hypothetical protein DPMN_189216 [Dreissena polymorpha]|uniref:Uncharacterized protein n=1 Tax=Dreissena polymorpha TaxID=45954 RepID=A0A9D4IAM5_DREPO|nr:hypothetical protein DPMN_189216 [Dreissena polymorpha]
MTTWSATTAKPPTSASTTESSPSTAALSSTQLPTTSGSPGEISPVTTDPSVYSVNTSMFCIMTIFVIFTLFYVS